MNPLALEPALPKPLPSFLLLLQLFRYSPRYDTTPHSSYDTLTIRNDATDFPSIFFRRVGKSSLEQSSGESGGSTILECTEE